jgi:predicted flap endonuclease-1-like 5' DNA nuclease
MARELAALKSTREGRQRDTFLDRFPIRRAKISGIGPAKTATLASYGIETAADVKASAIMAVPGFGEAMTAKLMVWRRGHEAKFRYNPAPDASDIQADNAVRAAAAAKRSDLQSKIRSGLAALQNGPAQLTARAKLGDPALNEALGVRAQAAHDLKQLGIAQPAGGSPAAPVLRALAPQPPTTSSSPPAAGSSQGLTCPQCGSRMVRRTARTGRRAGRAFWGCSRYPTCRGTRN